MDTVQSTSAITDTTLPIITTTTTATTITVPTTATTNTEQITEISTKASTVIHDEPQPNHAVTIGIIVGAFSVGVITAIVGIFLYRRYIEPKRRDRTTHLVREPEQAEQKASHSDTGPYSVVDIQKHALDDGYAVIKGEKSNGTKQNDENQDPPAPLPRPALTSPPTQIEFNSQTTIQINSGNISVDGVQEEYYLDILPDERASNNSNASLSDDRTSTCIDGDLYEDVSDTESPKINKPKSKRAKLKTPPLTNKPKPKSSNKASYQNIKINVSTEKIPDLMPPPLHAVEYINVSQNNSPYNSTERLKPNIAKKPKVHNRSENTINDIESDSNTKQQRTDSMDGENNGETEELYENVPTSSKTINVPRTSDNIVMYVNCVVTGVPDKSVQTTEL